MKKHKIIIDFEADEVTIQDLNAECRRLREEFSDTDVFDLENLSVSYSSDAV